MLMHRSEDFWPDPSDRTAVRLRAVRAAVLEYQRREGKLPSGLEVVRWRDRDGSTRLTWLSDAWNRPIIYTVSDTVELRSPGPDGEPNTPDDIVVLITHPRSGTSP